jgi:hypothetical protein
MSREIEQDNSLRISLGWTKKECRTFLKKRESDIVSKVRWAGYLSIFFYSLDFALDIFFAINYWKDSRVWYFVLTLTFIIATAVAQSFSFTFSNWEDLKKFRNWNLETVLSVFLFCPIAR